MGAEQSTTIFADIDKSDEGLLAVFETVDTDGSGKISASEMAAYVQKISVGDEASLASMMQKMDANGDGEIDLAEFKAILRAGVFEKGSADDGTVEDPTAAVGSNDGVSTASAAPSTAPSATQQVDASADMDATDSTPTTPKSLLSKRSWFSKRNTEGQRSGGSGGRSFRDGLQSSRKALGKAMTSAKTAYVNQSALVGNAYAPYPGFAGPFMF